MKIFQSKKIQNKVADLFKVLMVWTKPDAVIMNKQKTVPVKTM